MSFMEAKLKKDREKDKARAERKSKGDCCKCWYSHSSSFDGLTCRRFPPISARTNVAVWPVTSPFGWCGEFKPKESKQ